MSLLLDVALEDIHAAGATDAELACIAVTVGMLDRVDETLFLSWAMLTPTSEITRHLERWRELGGITAAQAYVFEGAA